MPIACDTLPKLPVNSGSYVPKVTLIPGTRLADDGGRVGRTESAPGRSCSAPSVTLLLTGSDRPEVRSPYHDLANRHTSRTVALATPRPATCCTTRYPSSAAHPSMSTRLNLPSTEPPSATSTYQAQSPAACAANQASNLRRTARRSRRHVPRPRRRSSCESPAQRPGPPWGVRHAVAATQASPDPARTACRGHRVSATGQSHGQPLMTVLRLDSSTRRVKMSGRP